MRIITIDNGNTNPHAGVFINDQLVEVTPLQKLKMNPNDISICSSVGKTLDLKTTYEVSTFKSHSDASDFLGMPIDYSKSLGDDRLIIAHYIFSKMVDKNERILIVDAGTFLTADLVTKEGFKGGFIFPGIKTFLASYKQGSQLPSIDPKEFKMNSPWPSDTQSAILGACEIYLTSILETLIKKISPSKVVFTGGNTELISNIYKKTSLELPFEKDPHLIHLAMFSLVRSHLDQ